MIIGDTHCGRRNLTSKLDRCKALGIQHALVVGDFGLFPKEAEGHDFLDAAQASAEANGLTVYAIPGNHEDHDAWEFICENWTLKGGWGMARRRVLLAPKAHRWKWAGKTFISAGGATSIDRHQRRQWEEMPHAGGPRTQWWPNEELTDDNMVRLKGMAKLGCDYLITHDASNYTNFGFALDVDPVSAAHREKIDHVLDYTRPHMHFHGHMHSKYDWVNTQGTGLFGSQPVVQAHTIGLECNSDYWSWGVLDLNANAKREWTWGPNVTIS